MPRTLFDITTEAQQQYGDEAALLTLEAAVAAIHARERLVDARTAYAISRGQHIGKPAPQPQPGAARTEGKR